MSVLKPNRERSDGGLTRREDANLLPQIEPAGPIGLPTSPDNRQPDIVDITPSVPLLEGSPKPPPRDEETEKIANELGKLRMSLWLEQMRATLKAWSDPEVQDNITEMAREGSEYGVLRARIRNIKRALIGVREIGKEWRSTADNMSEVFGPLLDQYVRKIVVIEARDSVQEGTYPNMDEAVKALSTSVTVRHPLVMAAFVEAIREPVAWAVAWPSQVSERAEELVFEFSEPIRKRVGERREELRKALQVAKFQADQAIAEEARKTGPTIELGYEAKSRLERAEGMATKAKWAGYMAAIGGAVTAGPGRGCAWGLVYLAERHPITALGTATAISIGTLSALGIWRPELVSFVSKNFTPIIEAIGPGLGTIAALGIVGFVVSGLGEGVIRLGANSLRNRTRPSGHQQGGPEWQRK